MYHLLLFLGLTELNRTSEAFIISCKYILVHLIMIYVHYTVLIINSTRCDKNAEVFVPENGQSHRVRQERMARWVPTAFAVHQHRHNKRWDGYRCTCEQHSHLDLNRTTPQLTRSWNKTRSSCTALERAHKAYTACMSDATGCNIASMDTRGCTAIDNRREHEQDALAVAKSQIEIRELLRVVHKEMLL